MRCNSEGEQDISSNPFALGVGQAVESCEVLQQGQMFMVFYRGGWTRRSVKGIFPLSDRAAVARLLVCRKEESSLCPLQIASVPVAACHSDGHKKPLRV